MNEEPLVSIVINNYNYGRFLGDAIDSALDQTHPRTEVVVVDDGSTDNSREVISGYGERIVPVLKENGGQASACNVGFEASSGEIVIFLDSDDMLLPDIVQRVAKTFETNSDLVKVQYKVQFMDAQGTPTKRFMPRRRLPSGELLDFVLKFQSYPRPSMSGNAFTSGALRRILPIPEALYRLGGADLYLNDLIIAFGPITSLKETGALRRMHGDNLHKSIRSMDDLAPFRLVLLRFADTRERQRRLFEEIESIRIKEVGRWDLFFLRDRMIYLKLDPLNHPFEDSLLSLGVRGCVSAVIYPGLGWRTRAFYVLWFLAMPPAPWEIADTLTRSEPHSGDKKLLPRKLLASFWKFLRRGFASRKISADEKNEG